MLESTAQKIEFASPRVVQDILAYLYLAQDPVDELAFRRICNKPIRGIGPATENAIVKHAIGSGIPYYDALAQLSGVGSGRTVGREGLDYLADRLSWLALGYSHRNWETAEFLDVIFIDGNIGYEKFALERSRSPDAVRTTVATLRDLAAREPELLFWDVKHDGKAFVADMACIASKPYRSARYRRRYG